jgi:hypothetical protein
MNASEILTKFETMVGDSLDQDFELQLANDAMHEIEEDVRPEGLKAVETTDSTFAGQTYTTAIDLPSDFFLPAPYIYVGTERYYQVHRQHHRAARRLQGRPHGSDVPQTGPQA